ncbi:hypothetical protein CRENBAI_015105 [Crenichthys baileyi]|uniref:Uncharacterized protein n=1 Tax=Crenichthys baileyi TaxID=28760 RepID=A0AAV9SR80_9TELE
MLSTEVGRQQDTGAAAPRPKRHRARRRAPNPPTQPHRNPQSCRPRPKTGPPSSQGTHQLLAARQPGTKQPQSPQHVGQAPAHRSSWNPEEPSTHTISAPTEARNPLEILNDTTRTPPQKQTRRHSGPRPSPA